MPNFQKRMRDASIMPVVWALLALCLAGDLITKGVVTVSGTDASAAHWAIVRSIGRPETFWVAFAVAAITLLSIHWKYLRIIAGIACAAVMFYSTLIIWSISLSQAVTSLCLGVFAIVYAVSERRVD
jgi:hypothetical protein